MFVALIEWHGGAVNGARTLTPMTLIIMGLYVTFSRSDSQHNNALSLCWVSKSLVSHFIIMLIIIMLSVITLNVVMLSVII